MEITENKFKQWCNKQGYYSQKLLTHTSTGNGNRQVADFLVANNNSVYFVECKQRQGNSFRFEDLTQEIKLKLAFKKAKAITPLILINFITLKTIILIPLQNYLELKESIFKKSINIKDIPDKYKFNWKSLYLPKDL